VADKRLKLTASEIAALLLAERRKKIPDTQSVSIRPYSGPKNRSFTWELDKIAPAVSPKKAEFADVEGVVGQLRSQYDLKRGPAKKRA
jgi:hypothetical protein